MNKSVQAYKTVLFGLQKQSNHINDWVATIAEECCGSVNNELEAIDKITYYLDHLQEFVDHTAAALIVGSASAELKKLNPDNVILKVSHPSKESPKVVFKYVPISGTAKSDDIGRDVNYWVGAAHDHDVIAEKEIDVEMADHAFSNVDRAVLEQLHAFRDDILPTVTDEIRSKYTDVYEQCLMASKDFYKDIK